MKKQLLLVFVFLFNYSIFGMFDDKTVGQLLIEAVNQLNVEPTVKENLIKQLELMGSYDTIKDVPLKELSGRQSIVETIKSKFGPDLFPTVSAQNEQTAFEGVIRGILEPAPNASLESQINILNLKKQFLKYLDSKIKFKSKEKVGIKSKFFSDLLRQNEKALSTAKELMEKRGREVGSLTTFEPVKSIGVEPSILEPILTPEEIHAGAGEGLAGSTAAKFLDNPYGQFKQFKQQQKILSDIPDF